MWSLTLVAVLLFPMVHLCYDKLRKSPGMQVAVKKSMHKVSRVYGRKTPGISLFFAKPPQLFTAVMPFLATLAIDRTNCQCWEQIKHADQKYFQVEGWKLLTGLPSFSNTKDSQTTQKRCKEDKNKSMESHVYVDCKRS